MHHKRRRGARSTMKMPAHLEPRTALSFVHANRKALVAGIVFSIATLYIFAGETASGRYTPGGLPSVRGVLVPHLRHEPDLIEHYVSRWTAN